MPTVTDPALLADLNSTSGGASAPPTGSPRIVTDPALLADLNSSTGSEAPQTGYVANIVAGLKEGLQGIAGEIAHHVTAAANTLNNVPQLRAAEQGIGA